jgi:hypothetical protein
MHIESIVREFNEAGNEPKEEFGDYMFRTHGPKVTSVVSALPQESSIIGSMNIDNNLQDKLFQSLVCEIEEDLNALKLFFNIGKAVDPQCYYRDILTETKGLDAARKEFDLILLGLKKKTMVDLRRFNEIDPTELLTQKQVFRRQVMGKDFNPRLKTLPRLHLA